MAYLSKIGIDTGSARVYLALAACLAIQALQVYAEVEQQAGTSPAVEQVVTEYVVPEPSLTFGRYASIAFGLSSIAHVFYALHHRKQVELGYYGVLGAITAFLVGLGLNGYLNDRPLGLYYDAGIVLGGYSLAALVPTGSILADKNLEYFFTKSSQLPNTEIQDAITELEKTVTDMDATMTALKDPAKTKVTENSLKDLKCATLFLKLIVDAINASKYKPADYASLGKKLDQAIKTVQEEGIDKIISDKAKTDPTKWDNPATETTDTKIQAYKKYHTDYKELTYDKVGKAVPASGKGTDCVLTFKVSVTSAPVGAAQLAAKIKTWNDDAPKKTIDGAFTLFKEVVPDFTALTDQTEKDTVMAEFIKLKNYITDEITKVTGYTKTDNDTTMLANAIALYKGLTITLAGVTLPVTGLFADPVPTTPAGNTIFKGDDAAIKPKIQEMGSRKVEAAYTTDAKVLTDVGDATAVKAKSISDLATLYKNIIDKVDDNLGFDLKALNTAPTNKTKQIAAAIAKIGIIETELIAKLNAITNSGTAPAAGVFDTLKADALKLDASKYDGRKEMLGAADYKAARAKWDSTYLTELLADLTTLPSGITIKQRVANLVAVYEKFASITVPAEQDTARAGLLAAVKPELKLLKDHFKGIYELKPDYEVTPDATKLTKITEAIADIGTVSSLVEKSVLEAGTPDTAFAATNILQNEHDELEKAEKLFSGTQYDNIKAIKQATTDVAAAVAGTGNLKVIADKIVVADGLLQTHATAATDTATAPVYGAPYAALQAACKKAFDDKIDLEMKRLVTGPAGGTAPAFNKDHFVDYEKLAEAAEAMKDVNDQRITVGTKNTELYKASDPPLKTLLEHRDKARTAFNAAPNPCTKNNTTVDASTSTAGYCADLVKEIRAALDLVPKGTNLTALAANAGPLNAKAVALKTEVDKHIGRVRTIMGTESGDQAKAIALRTELTTGGVDIATIKAEPYDGTVTVPLFEAEINAMNTAAA